MEQKTLRGAEGSRKMLFFGYFSALPKNNQRKETWGVAPRHCMSSENDSGPGL
jgi:hypothetical protein